MSVTGAPDFNQAFPDEEAHYQHHRDVEAALGGGINLFPWGSTQSDDQPDDDYFQTNLFPPGKGPLGGNTYIGVIVEDDTSWHESYLTGRATAGTTDFTSRWEFDAGTSDDGSDVFASLEVLVQGKWFGNGANFGTLRWEAANGDPARLTLYPSDSDQADEDLLRLAGTEGTGALKVFPAGTQGGRILFPPGGYGNNAVGPSIGASTANQYPYAPAFQEIRVIVTTNVEGGDYVLVDSDDNVFTFAADSDAGDIDDAVDDTWGADVAASSFFQGGVQTSFYLDWAIDGAKTLTPVSMPEGGSVMVQPFRRGGLPDGEPGSVYLLGGDSFYSAGMFIKGQPGRWTTFVGDFVEMVQPNGVPDPPDRLDDDEFATAAVRIYVQDTGGKSELLAVFPTGAAQRLAIEP